MQLVAPCPSTNELTHPMTEVAGARDHTNNCTACSGLQQAGSAGKDGGNRASKLQHQLCARSGCLHGCRNPSQKSNANQS